MSLEQKINYQLNKFPALKRVVKRAYQRLMVTLSPGFTSEGEISRVSPDDEKEYFYGYYDKSPWDASGRYMLCMRANDTRKCVAPKESADILLIDTENENKVKKLASSASWNVQQGCMAQWLGPDFSSRIIYNDFRSGKYCSVILDVTSGEEKEIAMPVYTVSADGKTALSLDFSRLHRLRPGYGYSNLPDETVTEKIPARPAIYRIDLENRDICPILSYKDLSEFEPRPDMENAVHKVNHLMLSPNGKRFMVLHRWFDGQRKFTRLVTANIDGTDLFNLSDDDMVSHCFWKNDEEILAFENKEDGGPGYYLMKDKTREYKHLWKKYNGDGHPSYSPDGSRVVTDSYPDRRRIYEVRLLTEEDENAENVLIPARVFAPFSYDNDTRCDLHPRFKRDGSAVAFDAVFEGRRRLYTFNIPERKD